MKLMRVKVAGRFAEYRLDTHNQQLYLEDLDTLYTRGYEIVGPTPTSFFLKTRFDYLEFEEEIEL